MLDRARHRLGGTALRRWYFIHKWSSLISTLFLLMLCITGLPLIFYEEIDHALGYSIEPPVRSGVTAWADLDDIVRKAAERRPGHAVQFLSQAAGDPNAWFVSLAETLRSEEASGYYMFDARTGEFLHDYPLHQGVMHFL